MDIEELNGFVSVARRVHQRTYEIFVSQTDQVQDCGKHLYGDFDNSHPEDVDTFAGILQQSNHTTTPQVQSEFPSPITLLPAVDIAQNTDSTGSQEATSNAQGLGARRRCHAPTIHDVSDITFMKKYLELCINTGEFQKSLGEIEVTGVCSDGLLFQMIKKKYLDLRSYRARYFLLKPTAIQFVQVGVNKLDEHYADLD